MCSNEDPAQPKKVSTCFQKFVLKDNWREIYSKIPLVDLGKLPENTGLGTTLLPVRHRAWPWTPCTAPWAKMGQKRRDPVALLTAHCISVPPFSVLIRVLSSGGGDSKDLGSYPSPAESLNFTELWVPQLLNGKKMGGWVIALLSFLVF